MADLLTIAALAKALSLPESTVRYYRDRFSAYVPSVGEGRSRRYRAEALEVLRFIAEALRKNTPAEDVEAALQARFPITVEPQQQTAATQQQQRNTAAVPQQLIAEALRNTEKALLEVAAETAALRNELQKQQQQTAAARQAADLAAQEAAVTREALAESEKRHAEAFERMHQAQERQAEDLREWLEKRLPEPQAKRVGLVARMKAILWGDRKHGKL